MFIRKVTGSLITATLSGIAAFTAAEIAASQGNCKIEPDFLLILGCRVRGDHPEPTLQTRINAAADYLNKHENVTAICCGGIVHDDQTKSEAQAISDGLIERGIKKERIILEDKSRTTAENFSNSKKIIDAMNLENEPKIAFLSSEYHLLRASLIGRIVGIKTKTVPAPSPKDRRMKNYFREFSVFPSTCIESLRFARKK